MTFDLKSILLNLVLPAIKVISPEAGKTIADAQEALADGHLSHDEVTLLIGDALDTAKALLPQSWNAVMDDLKTNLEVDLPNIEKTIKDIQALSAPANP